MHTMESEDQYKSNTKLKKKKLGPISLSTIKNSQTNLKEIDFGDGT